MIQIPAVIERCAGIDVGKRELAVAVIAGPADQDGEVKTRIFGTTVPALEELRDWLIQEGCTSVAMESTGSYWIPVKNVLEADLRIVLVCAKQHKPPRGDKTDFRDAKNLAHLHRHGLLKGSFLPQGAVVELRDLTRRRKKLLANLSAEKNRIQKALEVANVKIGSIICDVFGVSGQAMVSVLLTGKEISAEEIAGLSKRRLRQRIPELSEALQGHQMNDHHRWLIAQSVEHAVLLDRQMEELEARIAEKVQPYREQYELLQTIPGVKEMTAASILAEIGPDMSVFETAKHLCSWAGISPGNNRSAGKAKHSRIKKGSKFLLSTLVEAAWAAARKRDSMFQQKFHRWMRKLGKAKANVALARNLLEVAYAILKERQPYQEPDSRQMRELEKAKLVRHHAKRLRQLGADDKLVQELVTQLNPPAVCSGPSLPMPPQPIRRTCPAKVCRGALGFRARQTRDQVYTIAQDRAAKSSKPQGSKRNKKPPKAHGQT